MTALETEMENLYCGVPAEYLNIIQVIFTKNQNQLFAQYAFLFVVRSPTCFGQIYWPFSGSHKQ
jgi:hypothetical protein